MNKSYIKWFREVGVQDVAQVGGKNANLGEMYRHLTSLDVKVPNGFAVTSDAYLSFLEYNNLWEPLKKILYEELDIKSVESLETAGAKCRELIHDAKIPDDIQSAIISGYKKLQEEYGDEVRMAVRSSATAEDSAEASFAKTKSVGFSVRWPARSTPT